MLYCHYKETNRLLDQRFSLTCRDSSQAQATKFSVFCCQNNCHIYFHRDIPFVLLPTTRLSLRLCIKGSRIGSNSLSRICINETLLEPTLSHQSCDCSIPNIARRTRCLSRRIRQGSSSRSTPVLRVHSTMLRIKYVVPRPIANPYYKVSELFTLQIGPELRSIAYQAVGFLAPCD